MIHFEHINLVVADIAKMLTFYQAAFPQWFVRNEGHDTWQGAPRHWLHLGDDYQYLAMSAFPEDKKNKENRNLSENKLGLAHFAFVTTNLEAIINRLAQAGFTVDKEGANNPYRSNCYFIDPSGFEVEFVQYFTDVPKERNSTI